MRQKSHRLSLRNFAKILERNKKQLLQILRSLRNDSAPDYENHGMIKRAKLHFAILES